MIKKIVILVLIFNLISIIQSCCTEEYEYKWTDVRIDILDNAGELPILTTNYPVNKKALGFRIALSDTAIQIVQGFRLMNTTYATSCGQNYTRTHNLVSLKIKTLFEYSQKYPGGSDITGLFMGRESENTKSAYASIEDTISKINEKPRTYSTVYTGYIDFDLYLLDTTAITGEQRFEVELKMSDGTVFTQQTDTIALY
jgi:hypothetical protein